MKLSISNKILSFILFFLVSSFSVVNAKGREIIVHQCMVDASNRYSIPLRALVAVWLTEGGKIGTVSKNTNNTVDHGPMQINTIWANKLQKEFGITKDMITNDFCSNIMSAAYILRYEINAANGNFWDGVGHYHSHTAIHKYPYIRKVYNNSLTF